MIPLNKKIVIAPSFCVGICISLLILPFPWVAAWFAAGLIHEFGHFFALKMFHIPVLRITVDFKGAFMETEYMPPIAELLSALAGPLAGLCCLLLSSYLPLLAVCAFVQSVYNLLPFPGYDGGRVLRVMMDRYLPPHIAEPAYRWFLILCCACMIVFGMYMWFTVKLGPVIFLFFLIPVIKSGIIKIPCKQSEQIVQ